VNFVGRKEMLDTITGWYKNPKVQIGALIGWGGVGKSALVRKWYDNLKSNNIKPDGIFWWGFYRNAYLEQFLNALLRYVTGGQIEPDTIKSTWDKVERIKENIGQGAYLIILDGLEQMQKGESGDEFGKMIHRECAELLHYLADVPKAKGLCLITTRFPLKDLDDWHKRGYENQPLIDLSIPDALSMLKKRGVNGSDEDMIEVTKKYKGHALSLTSVAGYLRRYYGGDIKQAPNVEFVLGDKDRFKDVNKLLSRYADKMSKPERTFLNIFSLFRGDITEDDFVGVFRHQMEGTKCNNALVEMDELDFRDLINGLVDWRLIACDETKKTYSTHPLIKSYFEADFSEKDKKLCHKRIYQYIGEYAPQQPETLEEMQPLFEQVYHGCAAGLYDEVFSSIYRKKIGGQACDYKITKKLGAEGINLSLVKMSFPEGNFSEMPLVSNKSAQIWLLNEAGMGLSKIGRPKEAEEPFLTGVKMSMEGKDWEYASAGYRNLADLQFRTGEIESGLESSKKALDLARKAKSDRFTWASKAYLGWMLHILGKSKEAENQFSQADELCEKTEGFRIYSGWGNFYADFLNSTKRFDEAFELTKQNLEICRRDNFIQSISRCKRCFGAIEMKKGSIKKAEGHIQDALDIAHKIGVPNLEIEALLERGRLRLDMEKYEVAISDANEVLKICGRTGFKLYEPAAELILARAYLEKKDFDKAETNAHSAYEKAINMKYRWAEGDAAHLLGQIYLAMGDKAKARQWLKKAIFCRKEILDPTVKESETLFKNLS